MEARTCWESQHGLADIGILSRARSEGKHLLVSAGPGLDSEHVLASMIHFDSDMSKSTDTVVCFDWKMVIYIYVCEKCSTQFMLSVTFIGACANEIIPNG